MQSPGYSELSSTQNDDIMDISLESTSDTCDQRVTLLFSSDEAMNFNHSDVGDILSQSHPPAISQDAHVSATHQDASMSATCQLASMSTTCQDAFTPHHPAIRQETSTPHPPLTRQDTCMPHPLATHQDTPKPHPPSTSQDTSMPHPPATSQDNSVPWCGFKICGDNIDKNVRCRHMRIDKQTQSLHYFQSYAMRDRVDCSNLSDDPPNSTPTVKDVISNILPTEEDDAIIHDEFAILVARILCKHMTFFQDSYADVVDWHIEHEFSQEMCRKSEVVSIVCHNNYYIITIDFTYFRYP